MTHPKITFISSDNWQSNLSKTAGIVVFLTEGEKLDKTLAQTLDAGSGYLMHAIKTAGFKGKKKEILPLLALAGAPVARVYLVGLGSAKELDALTIEETAAEAVARACKDVEELVLLAPQSDAKKLKHHDIAAHQAFAARLRMYRFDKYRTTEKTEDKPKLSLIHIATSDVKATTKAHEPLAALAEGVLLTRNVVSEPANVIYPASLAQECKALESLGVKVTVLGEAEMTKLGMGSLLGVGQGSIRESQLVVMQWQGADKKEKPLAFVGKGVCFDTGGISIKPAGGMEDMKWDMAGAGAVIGAMRCLAQRKASVNVVGVVGLVENMPDGNAQRPGDVVTSMSGQTIEVLNTDAEGRLVLADALWYVQEKYAPRLIVDLATLTGAIIIALGASRAGLFSNDDKLADSLFALGKSTGEALWRLPLGDVYDKQINSDIADMRNIGEGREAGSITAAQFLQRFIKEGTPWAHLDIAGTAWNKKDSGITPKGASAFGVRLLDALAAEHEG